MQQLNLVSRGRLIGCPVAGWNCHDQKRLDLLGIDFQADELGTEAAAIAEAVAAYERKEPFLLYLWEPHWFFGAYEMVGVQLPEHKTCDSASLKQITGKIVELQHGQQLVGLKTTQ